MDFYVLGREPYVRLTDMPHKLIRRDIPCGYGAFINWRFSPVTQPSTGPTDLSGQPRYMVWSSDHHPVLIPHTDLFVQCESVGLHTLTADVEHTCAYMSIPIRRFAVDTDYACVNTENGMRETSSIRFWKGIVPDFHGYVPQPYQPFLYGLRDIHIWISFKLDTPQNTNNFLLRFPYLYPPTQGVFG